MACCGDEEVDLIADNKVTTTYQKGQRIFVEGGAALGMHCVHQGRIKVIKSGGDGKEQIIQLAKAGDVLGFRSLLMGNTYSTSAIALEECVVCHIPRADFFRVWQSNLQFSTSLMQQMARELGEAEVQLLHLAYKPVRERLAEALLLLYRTFHEEGGRLPFAMAISREDLASLVGTVKETATRLLSEFKERGYITTRGSVVTLLRLDELSRIASLYD